MTSIELRQHDVELLERVRYRKKLCRPVAALRRANATSSLTARRSTEIGLISTPAIWWLCHRGIVRKTRSGKLWLDEKRYNTLSHGAPIRVAIYVAIAGLFSGATLAMASAGI